MRKKLEAELISIAHRILQLKHKDDVRELHHEAQKLYEKLSVLLFVEENLGEIKPTIGLKEMESKLEHAFDYNDKVVVAQLHEEELDEIIETKSEETAQKIDPKIEIPTATQHNTSVTHSAIIEEKNIEEKNIETPTNKVVKEEIIKETIASNSKPIYIDDLLNQVIPEPIFERVVEKKEIEIGNPVNNVAEHKIIENNHQETLVQEETRSSFVPEFKEITFEKAEEKTATNLNDKISKSAGLTLNDRVAFEKNLFDGSTADLNRVISQIATFDTYEDAKNFIEEMVKPDYNDWLGKEEFASRFMEFIQSKFV